MKKSISSDAFQASAIVASKTASAFDSVFEELFNPKDITPGGDLILSTRETRILREFLLSTTPIYLLDKPEALSEDGIHFSEDATGKGKNTLNRPALNRFIARQFVGTEDRKTVRRLVTYVEVVDVKREDLVNDSPYKVSFRIRRDLITRMYRTFRVKDEDGNETLQRKPHFKFRRRMTLLFLHQFNPGKVGRSSQKSSLTMFCDRVSFMQNPSARYAFDSTMSAQDALSPLAFLMNFLMFPMRELHQVMSGLTYTQEWRSRTKTGELKESLREYVFQRVKTVDLYPLFQAEELEFKRHFQNRYLDRLQLSSVSFSFNLYLKDLAVEALLYGKKLTPEGKAEYLRDLMNRMVAAQSAIYGARDFVGNSSAEFADIKVSTVKAGLSHKMWKHHDDEDIGRASTSLDSNSIEKVELLVKRPVHGHSLFALAFHTFNGKKVSEQFAEHGEYEHLRLLSQDLGRSLPSGEQLAAVLDRSMGVTITAFKHSLMKHWGAATGGQLRDMLMDDTHHGSVDIFARSVLQKAMGAAKYYYLNDVHRWLYLVNSDTSELQELMDNWVGRAELKQHDEVLSVKEWEWLSRLPYRMRDLADSDGPMLREVHQLFEIHEGRDIHRHLVSRIKEVPKIATLCFLHWFYSPTEVLHDILSNAEFVPENLRAEYASSKLKKFSPEQSAMRDLAHRVHKFVFEEFGVDIDIQRSHHRKILNEQRDVFVRNRSKLKGYGDDAQPDEELLLEELRSFSQAMIRGLRTGKVFDKPKLTLED